MSPSARLLLALLSLAHSASPAQTAPAASAEPPERVARFEQMLVRSPGPGRAFDEVFNHWFSAAGGAAALEARWIAARDAAPAGSAQAAAYGLLLGQLAERIGDADTARARYAEAAAAAPADFRAHHRLGRLEIREGKLPAGLASLEKAAALEMSPADAQDVLRDLARARSRSLDDAGALKAWKDLADRFPDDALVLEEVGQAQLDATAYDDAATTFAALEKAAAGDAYRAVLARLRLGEVAARKGDKDAALARFSAALDGTHRDSWLHREAQARVDALFRQQGDFDGLVAFHEARLSGASRDPAAARRLAELLLELNRPDDAFAWFEKAAGWSPDDHALRFAHARALLAADRAEAALPILQALVKRHPKEADYRIALGQLHWDRAKSPGSAGFQPASTPLDPAAERALALDTWTALAPAGAPVADLLALADIYRSRGLDEETRATLARALAAEPASYDLRERLALQLLAMKRADEAWAIARNEPAGLADAAQYRRLAALEKRNDLPEAALASVARGLAYSPDNYELLDLRWQILAEQQKWDEALALFPALRASAPGDFALENIESRHLQALRSAGKADAESDALAARVVAEDATLTEADFRLHLRLVLARSASAPEAVSAAFAAARKRFPDSFSLALLEVEHLERSAPLAARVEALRRLAALRPERGVEWQRRIVGAHRFEGDHEGARRALADLLALAPADAQNHLLAAELEFEAAAPEAGIAALQRALRLAADPAPVRFRLARAYSDQGRPAAALQILEESYFNATDDAGRRAVAAFLAETAFAAGDLDGLVARFAERNRPRRETADYHVELGELYFHARDLVRAQETWNRALELRRDDLRLINRLLDLARQNGDQQETLRLAKLRHEREPSALHALDLGEALLQGGETEAALEHFLAHAAQFFQDPALLNRVLPALAREGSAQPLIDRLQATAASATNLADRDFVLASALASSGDLDGAERLLWQIYQRPAPPPPPAPAPADPNATPAPTPPPHMFAYRGIQTTRQAFQNFSQLLQQQPGFRGRNRFGSGFGFSSGPTLPANPTEPQDTALGYLGAIALHRDRAAAFLARLEEILETSGAPASERLHEFAKVQAREAIRRHLDAALDESAPDPVHLLAARNFVTEPHDYRSGRTPEPTPEIAEKLERIDALVAKSSPQSAVQTRLQKLYQLNNAKKHDEALALVEEMLAQTPPPPEAERRQLQQATIHILIEAGRWTEVLARLRADAEQPTFPTHIVFHAFGRYLQSNAPDGSPTQPELLPGFTDLVLAFLARPATGVGQVRIGRGGNAQHDIHQLFHAGAPLAANPGLTQNIHWLHSLLHAGDSRGSAVVERLLSSAADHADEQVRHAGRALAFTLAFQAGEIERAEKLGAALLADRPDPALEFNLAELAYRDDRLDVARARYEAITGATGSLAIAIQARLLEIALLDEKDREPAKAAAERLLRLRPPQYLPNLQLDQVLRELGLAGTPAAQTRQRASGANSRQTRHEQLNRLGNEMNELANKKDHDGAERLALRLIRDVTPQDLRQGNDWPRRRALETLVRIGRIDAHIDELEAALARSPGSIALLEQLANAHGAIRQNSSRHALAPLASTAEPLALPLRLRLTRRGDTLLAAYASLAPAADSAPAESPAPAESAPAEPPAPAWIELGSVALPHLGDIQPALAARNQNFRDLAAGRFASIRLAEADVDPATLATRDSVRLGDQTSAAHPLPAPLADGQSVEVTLLPPPAGSRVRIPVDRGLVLRDPADKLARVALTLDSENKLALSARRHTGLREIDHLTEIISRGTAEERLRTRYVDTLFGASRADEALAFIALPANADILPRFASHDNILNHYRQAGRLDEFADLVLAGSAEKKPRRVGYRELDHQVLEFARRLSRAKDTATALRVWEHVLDSASEYQSAEVRAELIETLATLDPEAARARARELVPGFYLPSARDDLPPPPAFGDSVPRHHQQPWYANGGVWGTRFQIQALALLDSITAPTLLRDLLADHAPRLAAAGPADWDVRCYDIALRVRALDPSAPAALLTLWRDTLAEQKKPGGNQNAYRSPLQHFVPAMVARLVTWPDPDHAIEKLFAEILAELPAVDARRGQNMPGVRTVFQNNQTEPALRLLWADFLLARGDTDRTRAALLDLARTFARQDPQQIQHPIPGLVLGRLIQTCDTAEVRRAIDTSLRRVLQRTRLRQSGNQSLTQLLAVLDALEGSAATKPALALWSRPAATAAEGALEIRWEVTALLDKQNLETSNYALPPVFGRDRAGAPDGAYDLAVQLFADEKAQPSANVELPAVAARGTHVFASPLPGGLLRAVLRPRDGGEEIQLPLQAFSTRPNLLASAATPAVEPAARPGEFHRLVGWHTPVPPLPGLPGPSGEGRSLRIDVPQRNSGERFVRTDAIPLVPGGVHLLDGWMYQAPDEHGNLQVEFLDAKGEVLNRSHLANPRGTEARWQRVAVVLGPGSRQKIPVSQRYPDNAVALRLCVGGNGLTFADLALREIPPPPAE